MKGDFSKLAFHPRENFTGVLHQQGRVLLDRDWNAATHIQRQRRQLLARDAIGADLVAVPAADAAALQVTAATADATQVSIDLNPGRAWIDGLHLHLPGPGPVTLKAEYLEPPFQAATDSTSIVAGVRDAVVLEVREEAFSAFQDPAELIEPALGGPDTTERVKLAYALKLLRLLDPEDDCGNLDLEDDFDAKGRLTVTPAPAVEISGDCPVLVGGGYTGFEHYLFRVEIAAPDPGTGDARLKWSRFNGGLVGRGTWASATQEVTITANDQMIRQSGLSDFYFEALSLDAALGHWRVVFSAEASLSDGKLALTPIDGGWPGADDDPAFFRLWDGARPISDFVGGPEDLQEGLGIRLEMTAPAADHGNYRPGDYWTFPVRAAGVDFDPSTWPSDAPPEGIHYHRAPLAILHWDAAPTVTLGPAEIDDCRHVFRPLTRLTDCCTFKVGDGLASHGDFDSIQDAVDALPPGGGRICVLPGEYIDNVTIEGKEGVRIVGCGRRSHVTSGPPDPVTGVAAPVFHVLDSQQVAIESLAVTADPTGVGILVEDSGDPDALPTRDVRLADLRVEARTRSGIEVAGGEGIEIYGNRVEMRDVEGRWPAVSIEAEEVAIERNALRVTPSVDEAGDESVFLGAGGLWLRGGCRRIRVIDNLIEGGIGNGITLGHVDLEAGGAEIPGVPGVNGWTGADPKDPCAPCRPGTGRIPPGGGTREDPTPVAGPPLEKILIERNRVQAMGLNGIAVIGFFEDESEVISVAELTIAGNVIRGCLQRTLEAVLDEMVDRMGYGGVVLADVETLLLWDNRIEDNGADHLQPICGVYVEHGEGLDISRNRILDNGAKTDQKATGAAKGARGGIFIESAEAPTFDLDEDDRFFPNVKGVPAVKVHDNVVSAPLGRALTITALGPVSVVGNQLTSHGVTSGSVLAGTVQIVNLGLPAELAIFGVLLSFLGLYSNASQGQTGFGTSALGFLTDNPFNGNVLFADNQVLLELLEEDIEWALTSVLIASLDDVAMEDNQCDCELLIDFVFCNALVFGITTRVGGNRFKEGILFAFLSALTLGYLNDTAHNQGTHCIIASSFGGRVVRRPNLELLTTAGLFGERDKWFSCKWWRQILEFGDEYSEDWQDRG